MTANAKAQPSPLPILRKPMARATRVALFEREVRERLSGPAIDLLLERAQVLAEGRRGDSPTTRGSFFGSIMLTIDLEQATTDVRERCDETTSARVADLMGGDPRFLRRVQAIAEREATRLAGAKVRAHLVDVRVRAEGRRVLVDIDVEG